LTGIPGSPPDTEPAARLPLSSAPLAKSICGQTAPLRPIDKDHQVACHLY
jgi:hypothetical protein